MGFYYENAWTNQAVKACRLQGVKQEKVVSVIKPINAVDPRRVVKVVVIY